MGGTRRNDEVQGIVDEVLMVVDLDGELSGGWGGAAADRLRELVVADFHLLVDGDASLEDEVEKVVEGLAGQAAKPSPQPEPTST